ncbi:ubiquitin conjugation factor E4 A [Cimex lectularius]|uniref:Ubiquitin conjugation factor E4 A n=1 Tax=Cimex lectularius TaxID=79782 RepID=A0A8I6RN17_CIMLE|nr:ubiquitin conjugation factor E4 A [Cimex lectularius]
MSGKESEKNPFLNLFSEPAEAPTTSAQEQASSSEDPVSSSSNYKFISEEVQKLAEDVFNITFTKDENSVKTGRNPQLVFMEELATTAASKAYVDLELLKIALFERLLLNNPAQHLICAKSKTKLTSNYHVVQTECMLYLFESYKRLKKITKKTTDFPEKIISNIITYVIENASTALRQPAIFEMQDVHRQVLTLYEIEVLYDEFLQSFISDIVNLIIAEEGKAVLAEAFQPILVHIHKSFANATLMSFQRSHFNVLNTFVTIVPLADLLLDYTAPRNYRVGLAYTDTLFGSMLNLSCLPKSVEAPVEYFEKPLDGALSALEGNLWTAMNELCERIHAMLDHILRLSPELRGRVLKWIGGCLDANLPRGRLWATTSLGLPGALGYISDGFVINLTSVMLRLSQPFITDQRKLLKIDPTYPAFRVELNEDMAKFGVHCKSLNKETCLLPLEEGEVRPFSSQPYSFITECFFMTHRALDLSVRILLERTQQLYQEIGRLQQSLNDAQSHVQPRLDIIDSFRETMELEMSRYLCMRCALLEPVMLKLLGQFEVATATWLIQVVLDPITEKRQQYAPMVMRPLKFPLPESGPSTLRCIPELVVESVGRFMKLAKTYSPQTLEEGGPSLMEPLMSLLLVLMGSKNRARNPHLRAHLAQCLECLLPRDQDEPSLNPNPLGVFYREKLFLEHPHRDQIVGCLLHVFVSIEMTGESVAFEQKFNYRRPMYTVMDYLWGIEGHRAIFRELADEAERNMEEVIPPLFLRFLNLLMNDAIFLLDEALSNMAQLRTLQTARDSGEWENLPDEERSRNEQFFRQIGMTAKFDNILGKETIHTIEYMSSEIKSILCHRMMVDRIAAMLNYFLYHLVGPKKKNFKVKDQTEFKFDPGSIVKDICRIYVHLGNSEEFCAAVSRDGRSYSPQLFVLASDVLVRIGGTDLLTELHAVSQEVARLAALQQTDEELLAEAPDEFLDPIMSTLMTDPVTLPSSRINIDRSTIARHLLSDQTDPFNRSPLTMNMVKSNTDLKGRIDKWISDKRNNRQDSNPGASTSTKME